MSNEALTQAELKDRIAGELGLESGKDYSMGELFQRHLAAGQTTDKGQLLAASFDSSTQLVALTHNNPIFNHIGHIYIPATDRYVLIEAKAFITKTSGNTTRGVARCQFYNDQVGVVQDGDSVYLPLEMLAGEFPQFVSASHIIGPSHVGRVYGAAWDTFQYAGVVTGSIQNSNIGGNNGQTQIKAYLL